MDNFFKKILNKYKTSDKKLKATKKNCSFFVSLHKKTGRNARLVSKE
jgi:hypothetical protein